MLHLLHMQQMHANAANYNYNHNHNTNIICNTMGAAAKGSATARLRRKK